MALVLGTNCGFVTTAPTSDPAGNNRTLDTYSTAFKVTSPATAIIITELGFYCGNATGEANFDIGIYTHNSETDEPKDILYVSRNNAKGTTEGWKVITNLNISITENTIYWLAVQVDNTATSTTLDYTYSAGKKMVQCNNSTSLLNPWGTTWYTTAEIEAIYAVWSSEAPPTGTNMKINIGDTFKDVSELKINIGDSWKAVTSAKINIGDSWKTIF